MKNLIFAFLLIISVTAYSQTEVVKDTFPPLKETPLEFNEKIDKYLDFNTYSDKTGESMVKGLDLKPLQRVGKREAIDLKLPPINVYTGPPLESNTFTRYPFANDYSFYSGAIINSRSWLTSSSIQNTYPTLGAVRTVSAHINYRPTDWLTVSGGPYASKYNLRGRAFNDLGATAAIKFILHDRIRFNAYGQYSVNGKANGVQGPLMSMYPQTYYGGTIEVKITEKFGIEGGIIRELNPFNGKWENRPYIAPVFYSK